MKLLLAATLLLTIHAHSQWKQLEPGKYTPGFSTYFLFDSTRPPLLEQPIEDRYRAIRINTWYPAKSSSEKGLTFKDYISMSANELNETEIDATQTTLAINNYFAWPSSAGADSASFYSFLENHSGMRASRDKPAIDGSFPLVLLANGSAADYASLGEYLAGHGYWVMQVPVQGSMRKELDYQEKGLDAQTLDLEFARKKLLALFPGRAKGTAVIGFSFGGQTAVAFAMRNPGETTAVVSLDGGIGSIFGTWLLGHQPWYNPDFMKAPILHLFNPYDPYADLKWFSHVKQTDRFLASIKEMQHGYFTSLGWVHRFVPGVLGKDKGIPDASFESVLIHTRRFLDQAFSGKIKNNTGFFAEVSKQQEWVKPTLLKTEVTPAGS